MKGIKESQQASQGINIGNQGGTVPEGLNGSNEKQNTTGGRNIPNQDQSYKRNEEKK